MNKLLNIKALKILGILLAVSLSACSNTNGDDDRDDREGEEGVGSLQTPVIGVPTAGRLLASQCAQCHGTDGHSVSEIDSLAGEDVSKIVEELSEMRQENEREIMTYHALGYTNEQIRLIAEYLGSIKGGDDDD